MTALGLTYENGYRDGTISSAGMRTNDLVAQRQRYRHRLEGTPKVGGMHEYMQGTVDAYQDEFESRNQEPPKPKPLVPLHAIQDGITTGLPVQRPPWSQQ